MKRFAMFAAALAFVLVATWAIAETETKVEYAPITWQQAALNDGSELYIELCASCHGVTGRGDGPAAPALSAPMPDLRKLAAMNDGEFPAKDLEKAISGESRVTAHGTPDMPVWGKMFESLRPDHKPVQRYAFAQQRVYNLIEHLRTLQIE